MLCVGVPARSREESGESATNLRSRRCAGVAAVDDALGKSCWRATRKVAHRSSARLCGRCRRRRRWGQFFRDKAAVLMRTVAERLPRRLAATAQSHHRLVHRDDERVAQVIGDFNDARQRIGAFNDQRTVRTHTNFDLRHKAIGVRGEFGARPSRRGASPLLAVDCIVEVSVRSTCSCRLLRGGWMRCHAENVA